MNDKNAIISKIQDLLGSEGSREMAEIIFEIARSQNKILWDDIYGLKLIDDLDITELALEVGKTATVKEGDQFIGVFSADDAPNDFIRNLVKKAIENGEAEENDAEGCLVTAVACEAKN